jgi:hypothetical protein
VRQRGLQQHGVQQREVQQREVQQREVQEREVQEREVQEREVQQREVQQYAVRQHAVRLPVPEQVVVTVRMRLFEVLSISVFGPAPPRIAWSSRYFPHQSAFFDRPRAWSGGRGDGGRRLSQEDR